MSRGHFQTMALAMLLVVAGANAQPAKDARRSGFDDMRPATQAMQRDDSQNPAMLWVAEGEALFQRAPRARRSRRSSYA